MIPTNGLEALPEELREMSQSRLVVVFYDQAIAALEDAIAAIEESDVERRFNAVKTATGLINELSLSLDESAGGEIAHNLGGIYAFILGRLPQVNTQNDPKPADEAIRLLRPLRDAWEELDRKIQAGEIPGFAPAPAFAAGPEGESTAAKKAA